MPQDNEKIPRRKKRFRVKTPTMLQMEATECGAAALGIVLAYYGLYLPLEQLRQDCGVSRDGSKAINMLKAARCYGMEAQGAKVEDPYDLLELPLPLIAFWEFDHFVVVEGIIKNRFYINDPETGPRVIDKDEFDRAFTGVVLIFEPTPEFRPAGKPASILRAFRERLRGSVGSITYIFLASLALVIPGIMIPGFSKIFIDEILIRGVNNWLHILLVTMVLTAIVRGILTWIELKTLLQLHLKMMLIHSAKFLWHVLHLPVAFFQQRFVGDLEIRVGANDRIAQLLSGEISSSAVNVVSMFFYGMVMFLLCWQLSVLAVFIALFNILLFMKVARPIADNSRHLLQQEGRLSGVEMSGLFMIETLKATGSEDGFFCRWASDHAQTINRQQKIMQYGLVLQLVPDLLMGLMTVAILSWGALLVMHGQVTIGTLVAFQTLVTSFLAPINGLLGLAEQTQEIRGDFARLDDVLKYPPEYSIEDNAEEMQPLSGELKMSGICFGYSKLEEPFIEDFNLHIRPGQRIALVGATGSGKSTLIRLICRLYKPWSGTIEIGGQLVENIPAKQFSKTIALVDQDIFLFSGTVRDNLTLWNPEIKDEMLHKALQAACVQDIVIARGGLDSMVSEGGANYSGGQRQRLEIARALAFNPSLLILDEATSSLDPAVELEVYENIKNLGCSVLIVAHRLSAIRDCDEIIVLDEGCIVQQDHHEKLIEVPGLYQQLLQVGE